MKPHLLLLQARQPDDPMKPHELECFVRSTGLPLAHLHSWDLLDGPPSADQVLGFDALSVGGAGEFDVSKRNLPDFDRLLDLLREIVARGHPTFASCFGYQLLVQAMGGEVQADPANTEVGTYELWLTPEGEQDELFGWLPARFNAQLGHKERAVRPPPALPNLAASERSPLQALRVPGKPIWASQFHPELDRATNLDRYARYANKYLGPMSPEEIERTAKRFVESPESSALLARFLDLVFG